MPSQKIPAKLKGRDRRSIGRSNKVVKLVLHAPRRFAEIIQCLWNDDSFVRMRAADGAEKVSAIKPELLEPWKGELLGLLAEAQQIELRWHLAQMVPRLPLTTGERQRASQTLQLYLEDRSSIVRTFALQALADLSRSDAGLRLRVREILEKARTRKLLNVMKN